MTARMVARAAAAALALAALLPAAAGAQQARGTLRTTFRYLELRPIRQDTVGADRVTVGEDSVARFEGFPVFCGGTERCVYYRPLDEASAMSATQDLSLTAWGFGVRGLSATVLLRGRSDLGGDLTLPLTDDRFDAVLAYLELNRPAYRVRLGRQRTLSGLGSLGFDGAEVLWDPSDWLRLTGFGGRSLGRGLSEPRSSALKGFDDADFLLDDDVWLVGGEVGVEGAGSSLALRYQREIYGDRSGLVSERASLTGRTDALRPVSLTGAADWDFAFGRVGKAHLTARLPVAGSRLMVEATGRRYLPYFELWTIWGFFSPVPYHEGELRATWAPRQGTALWTAGAYRSYGSADAPVEVLKDDGWRGVLGARTRLSPTLTLEGEYVAEGPVGAFLSQGTAALRWRPGDRLGLGVHALGAQRIDEYRVDDGAVVGGGVSADLGLLRGTRLMGGVDLYRQTEDARPGMDWNQLRSWMVLQVDFGRDPGGAR